MVSIRGAITVAQDLEHEIFENTTLLLDKIMKCNNLHLDRIVAIFFSCTKDLKSAYPAKAARALGIKNASLMCLQEMCVMDSLDKCIRLCIFYDDNIDQTSVKHVYLKNAAALRPDLVSEMTDCIGQEFQGIIQE